MLSKTNLEEYQQNLWNNSFNGTLIIIKSNFGKVFAFMMQSKFEEARTWKLTDK